MLLKLPQRWPNLAHRAEPQSTVMLQGCLFLFRSTAAREEMTMFFSVPSLLGSIQGNLESQMLQLLDHCHLSIYLFIY